MEPIYESLKSLPAASVEPAPAAAQNGVDTVSLKSAPLQRSPAVRSMTRQDEADDLAAQIEICKGLAKTLDDFSKTVRSGGDGLVPESSPRKETSADQLCSKKTNHEEIGQCN